MFGKLEGSGITVSAETLALIEECGIAMRRIRIVRTIFFPILFMGGTYLSSLAYILVVRKINLSFYEDHRLIYGILSALIGVVFGQIWLKTDRYAQRIGEEIEKYLSYLNGLAETKINGESQNI